MKMFIMSYAPHNEGGNCGKTQQGSKTNQGTSRKDTGTGGNRDMNRDSDTGMGNENDRNNMGRTQKNR